MLRQGMERLDGTVNVTRGQAILTAALKLGPTMKRLLTLPRLSIMFLGLFALSLAVMGAYEFLVREPGKRCEAAGKWYDYEGRECAQPIAIAEITKRPAGVSREDASREKLRELVVIEDGLAAQEKARELDADRQRAAYQAEQASR